MKMDDLAILNSLNMKLALDPENSKILVVGLGYTGMSVAHYLQKLGFKFAITDSRDKPPLMDDFLQSMLDTPVFTGGFNEAAFKVATHLVVSPGVTLAEKSIVKAIASGVRVISDIDLFACSVNEPVIAITGSNGKSTVTTMLGEMAKSFGKKVGVGGNLGTPALDLLEQDAEVYVLELSSFQLERTTVLNAIAATVLNISADHLDRHVDMAEYGQSKKHVFRGNGVMVINSDDPIVDAMRETGRTLLTFSIKGQADYCLGNKDGTEYMMYQSQCLMPLTDLPLEGRHNVANALAAIALGSVIGLDEQTMCMALKKFKGLDHRMQRVAEIGGITWVNDSKATNIGACIAALQGFDRKVILIAGGDAKGADMNELASIIKEKARHVVLIGKDAELITNSLDSYLPVDKAENMTQVVSICARIAKSGDFVLLSPACASLDQYKNYQDRGNQFSKAVLDLIK
jgi:UDP-N-acetylmuramoylalanine--D-glutamate ligase